MCSSKIVGVERLSAWARHARATGRRVALCHGCFDLLHAGHILHLYEASRLCDRLVVSVTADEYVRKGPDRPMFSARHRAACVASVTFVDLVTINDQPTAVQLLSVVRPNVFVKGAEYRERHDARFRAERRVIDRDGGDVAFTSDRIVRSSTALIEARRGRAGKRMNRQRHDQLRLANA